MLSLSSEMFSFLLASDNLMFVRDGKTEEQGFLGPGLQEAGFHERSDRGKAGAGSRVGLCAPWPAPATHGGLAAAVSDHLQHWVLLAGVNAGQVIKWGVHRTVGPFCKFPGQVPALGFMDLPLENIGQDLQQVRELVQAHHPWKMNLASQPHQRPNQSPTHSCPSSRSRCWLPLPQLWLHHRLITPGPTLYCLLVHKCSVHGTVTSALTTLQATRMSLRVLWWKIQGFVKDKR